MANLQETGDGMPGRAPPCCSWPPARPFLVARHPITVLTERQALTSASLPLPRQRFYAASLTMLDLNGVIANSKGINKK